MKRAIVLSGGGSKGAYQMGVWKALRRLNISYDIVTGTSVGALNGALMVQKDYLRGLWLWFNLDFKLIFDKKIDADYETKEGKNKIIKTYAGAILGGGMNVEELEHTVSKALNLKKIYKSSVDFGIVTVKLPNLKPILLRKKQIKPEQLKDYLIASASCFPAFQKKVINDVSYIDGGLYDNLPINFAIEMGATEVIAVDLEEIGVKQKVKYDNIPITYISPRNDIGSFLVFDKRMARRCIRIGYNDTMKKFQKLGGDFYTFKKDHLEKNYEKYYNLYITNIKKYLEHDHALLDKVIEISVFKRFLSSKNKTTMLKEFNKQIESLGKTFALDDSKIYDINKWNKLIVSHYSQLQENKEIEKNIKENKFKLLFNNEYLIKYLCDLMNQKRVSYKKISRLALFFPNEFLQAIYLMTLLSKEK